MKRARDQRSGDMGFAGMNTSSVSGSNTKFAHNQFSGHSNDGRLVQMKQQPNRLGNSGACHTPPGADGYGAVGAVKKTPPARA